MPIPCWLLSSVKSSHGPSISFGIQQGDRYKVIYEESFVDSVSIGIHRILGAWFYHNQTEFWGIPFEQDGVVVSLMKTETASGKPF